MQWDPMIYSFEAVHDYQQSRRQYLRLPLLAVLYAVIDLAAFSVLPRPIALASVAIGVIVFVIMAVQISREVKRAEDRLQSERRIWNVRQA